MTAQSPQDDNIAPGASNEKSSNGDPIFNASGIPIPPELQSGRIIKDFLRAFDPTNSLITGSDESDNRLVSYALDFHSDGQLKLHYTYRWPDPKGRPEEHPPFDCPIANDSIRVIFYSTKRVFPGKEPDHIINDRIIEFGDRKRIDCADCVLKSASPSVRTSIASSTSLPVSNSSHVSPKTQVHRPVSESPAPLISQDIAPITSSHHHGPAPAPTSDLRSLHRPPSQSSSRYHPRSRTRSGSGSINSSAYSHSSTSTTSEGDDDESWKIYRGASGLEVYRLFSFWERGGVDPTLRLGVNLMFDLDNESDVKDDEVWSGQALSHRHTVILGGDQCAFYTIPNFIRNWWLDGNALEVEIRFFSTLSRYGNANRVDSPLADFLWTILLSKTSAMALFNGNRELGARLIMFDFLDAALGTWFVFLQLVRKKGVWEPRSNYEELEEKVPAAGDRQHIVDFSKATRDLINAIDTTIRAIKLTADFDADRQKAFDYLLLKTQARTESLTNIMKDIEDYLDSLATRAERLTNERQESSLKRLTLVASIFLPLTMACSLLSMSNRVNEIGAVWWDWLGIVVILAAVIVTGYRFTSAVHNLRRRPYLNWILRGLKNEYRRAKKRALQKRAEKKKTKQRSVIPFFPKFMFRISKYIFIMGAIASFLIGMFLNGGDVAIGAESLGYSAAGTIGLVVFGILLWRLAKAAWWLVAHSAKREEDNEDGDDSDVASINPDSHASRKRRYRRRKKSEELERMRKKTMGGRAITLFCNIGFCCISPVCLPILICLWSVVYSTFTFFFGSLIFDVLWELTKKAWNVGMSGFGEELVTAFLQGATDARIKDELRERDQRAEEARRVEIGEESGSETKSGVDSDGEDGIGGKGTGNGSDIEKTAGKNKQSDAKERAHGASRRSASLMMSPGGASVRDPLSPIPGIRRVDTWGGMQRRGTMPVHGSHRQLQRHGTAPVMQMEKQMERIKKKKVEKQKAKHVSQIPENGQPEATSKEDEKGTVLTKEKEEDAEVTVANNKEEK